MRSVWFCATAAALALLIATVVHAAGPEVRSLFPAGGQRGTTVEVTLTGKFDAWPVSVWADRPGLVVTAAEEKGKLQVVIAADAAPGLRWLRVHDAAGTSAPQPFVVGTLPEVVEAEPNNGPATAQPLDSGNLVVNGRLAANGDVDVFSLPLAAGQTLVASLSAHEGLASPVDAVLHVVSADGFQLDYNHDGRGLDPEIVYTAPTSGTYLVRVFGFPSDPNSTIGFSGSDRHLYRLTLSTAGFVDYPWPLAIQRGQPAVVALHGWNIPPSLVERELAADAAPADGGPLELADERLANLAAVSVESHPAIEEIEPNDPSSPQAITLPVTISGRIRAGAGLRPGDPPNDTAERGDVDVYQFDATKGQPLEITLASRSLGYPLDGVLQIFAADGKSLARVDDVGSERDPKTVFTPPADGTYQVHVSDLNRFGSSRHVYRLRVTPATPDYTVTADALAYTIAADKPAELTLAIDRQHGFAEEIEFQVEGLPDFITATAPKSATEGDSAKSVKLVLTSSGGEFAGPIRIEARSTGPLSLARHATAAIPNHTARLTDLWLTAPPAEKK